jgi:nicotinate-nucleotide adenylyltransferase
MKIALFGGTFNPIHLGHLNLARNIITEQNLVDKIVFMPVFIPPHKEFVDKTEPIHRVEMIKLAIQEHENMEVSLQEIERGGISYTIETLRSWIQIRQTSGKISEFGTDQEKFIIIGSDSALNLHTWYKWEEILSLVKIIVYPRPGFKGWQDVLKKQKRWQGNYSERFIEVQGDFFNISSSEIREKIRAGNEIQDLVPPQVLDYIFVHGLYK